MKFPHLGNDVSFDMSHADGRQYVPVLKTSVAQIGVLIDDSGIHVRVEPSSVESINQLGEHLFSPLWTMPNVDECGFTAYTPDLEVAGQILRIAVQASAKEAEFIRTFPNETPADLSSALARAIDAHMGQMLEGFPGTAKDALDGLFAAQITRSRDAAGAGLATIPGAHGHNVSALLDELDAELGMRTPPRGGAIERFMLMATMNPIDGDASPLPEAMTDRFKMVIFEPQDTDGGAGADTARDGIDPALIRPRRFSPDIGVARPTTAESGLVSGRTADGGDGAVVDPTVLDPTQYRPKPDQLDRGELTLLAKELGIKGVSCRWRFETLRNKVRKAQVEAEIARGVVGNQEVLAAYWRDVVQRLSSN